MIAGEMLRPELREKITCGLFATPTDMQVTHIMLVCLSLSGTILELRSVEECALCHQDECRVDGEDLLFPLSGDSSVLTHVLQSRLDKTRP